MYAYRYAPPARRLPDTVPLKPVSLDRLQDLGILYWHLDAADKHETDPKLAAIRKVCLFSYSTTTH